MNEGWHFYYNLYHHYYKVAIRHVFMFWHVLGEIFMFFSNIVIICFLTDLFVQEYHLSVSLRHFAPVTVQTPY